MRFPLVKFATAGVLVLAGTAWAQAPSDAQLSARLSVGQTPVWGLSPTTTGQATLGSTIPSPIGNPPGVSVALPTGLLRLEARVDRPNLTYKVGERVMFRVRTSENAYLTIINTRADGTINVLLPNPFHRENRIRGGQEVQIPVQGGRYAFETICPAGVELITVIASRQPLPLPQLHPTMIARSSAFVRVDMTGQQLAETLSRMAIIATAPGGGAMPAGGTVWPSPGPATPTTSHQVPMALAGGGALAGAAVMNLLIQVQDNPAQPCVPGAVLSAGAPAPAPIDLPMHLVSLLAGAGGPPPLVPAAQPGIIRVQTERPVYRPGQPVHVMVSVGRACRLSVFHVRADGLTQQMFPNPQQPDQLVQSGEIRLVPSTDAAQRFTAGGGRGNESVIAVCEDPAQVPAVPVVAPAGPDWNPAIGGFMQVVSGNRIGIFASAEAPAPTPAVAVPPAVILDRQAISYSVEPAP